MEYPDDFPEHLKRPVDAAIHAAEIAFIDAKQGIAPHRFQYEAERLILRYVEAVFFGFAAQVVQAGKEGVWNGERIRRALPEFLDDLGHHAWFDKHPNPGAYHASEQFKATLNNKSKDWKGWRAIHEELRRVAGLHIDFTGTELARSQAAPPEPPQTARPAPTPALESKGPETREPRLQAFISEKQISIAALRRAARVAKANMQQWRRGELSDDSVMSRRIEDVLAAKTVLPTKG